MNPLRELCVGHGSEVSCKASKRAVFSSLFSFTVIGFTALAFSSVERVFAVSLFVSLMWHCKIIAQPVKR